MKETQTLEQWQMFWTIPLIFAVVVSFMFAFGFKERVEVDVARTRAHG